MRLFLIIASALCAATLGFTETVHDHDAKKADVEKSQQGVDESVRPAVQSQTVDVSPAPIKVEVLLTVLPALLESAKKWRLSQKLLAVEVALEHKRQRDLVTAALTAADEGVDSLSKETQGKIAELEQKLNEASSNTKASLNAFTVSIQKKIGIQEA